MLTQTQPLPGAWKPCHVPTVFIWLYLLRACLLLNSPVTGLPLTVSSGLGWPSEALLVDTDFATTCRKANTLSGQAGLNLSPPLISAQLDVCCGGSFGLCPDYPQVVVVGDSEGSFHPKKSSP